MRLSVTKSFVPAAGLAGSVGLDTANIDIIDDAARGEKTFRKCMARDESEPYAKSKSGLNLTGILMRAVDVVEGLKFSRALTPTAGNRKLALKPKPLDAFLNKPKDFLSGKMTSLNGLREARDREDVITNPTYYTSRKGD